jgi:hypothetical protein
VQPLSPCYLTNSGHYSTGCSWSRRAWLGTSKVPSSPSSKSGKTPRSSSASLVDHPPVRSWARTYRHTTNTHSLTHSLTNLLTHLHTQPPSDVDKRVNIRFRHLSHFCIDRLGARLPEGEKRSWLYTYSRYLAQWSALPISNHDPIHTRLGGSLRSWSVLAIFSVPRPASDFFPFPAHREPESQKNLFVAPRRCPRLEGPWFQFLPDPRLRAVASSFAYSF